MARQMTWKIMAIKQLIIDAYYKTTHDKSNMTISIGQVPALLDTSGHKT